MARPSKYLKEVQYRLGEVEEWATMGLTNKQIAANLGISETRLYEWQNQFVEFREALKRGKDVADYEVENALHRSATGFYYEEDVVTQEGIVRIQKYAKPNSTAIIFWLRNRRTDKWRDKHEVDMNVTETRFVINMSDEEDDESD